jgi:hypothetical protein
MTNESAIGIGRGRGGDGQMAVGQMRTAAGGVAWQVDFPSGNEAAKGKAARNHTNNGRSRRRKRDDEVMVLLTNQTGEGNGQGGEGVTTKKGSVQCNICIYIFWGRGKLGAMDCELERIFDVHEI